MEENESSQVCGDIVMEGFFVGFLLLKYGSWSYQWREKQNVVHFEVVLVKFVSSSEYNLKDLSGIMIRRAYSWLCLLVFNIKD